MTRDHLGVALCLLAVGMLPVPAGAQWLKHPTPGIPRTADGKPDLTAPAPRTADGKPDLSGLWLPATERYYNNIRVGLDPMARLGRPSSHRAPAHDRAIPPP
jgi:hypothetical protein